MSEACLHRVTCPFMGMFDLDENLIPLIHNSSIKYFKLQYYIPVTVCLLIIILWPLKAVLIHVMHVDRPCVIKCATPTIQTVQKYNLFSANAQTDETNFITFTSAPEGNKCHRNMMEDMIFWQQHAEKILVLFSVCNKIWCISPRIHSFGRTYLFD